MAPVTWALVLACLYCLVAWLDRRYLNHCLAFNSKIALFYFLVSIIAFFAIPLFLLFDCGDCVNSKRVSVLLRQFSHVLGVQWEVRGRHIMECKEGCVILVNHQSSLDILGLFWIWQYFDRMTPIARREIFYVWPFGLSAYLAGVLFIDRSNVEKAKQQLQQIASTIHEKRTKLLIFPEGTRNPFRSIKEFKKGGFHMAISSQAPIMPIVFSPYFFINPKNKFFGSGRVIIEALPLVETKGLQPSDMETLISRVHEQMVQKYQQLYAELKATLPPDYPGLF